MKLVALDMPEGTAAQAVWLEQQIVGADLRTLAAELVAFSGQKELPIRTAAEVLGPALVARVLQDGLKPLDTFQLRQLIKTPSALLDLQRLIDESESQYWSNVFAQVWSADEHGSSTASPSAAVELPRPMMWQLPAAWSQYALAASLLLALWGTFMYLRSGPPSGEIAVANWGWNDTQLSPATVTADAYLRSLAAGAQQWFNKRPDSAGAVAQRINELRMGCSRLILAQHTPLAAQERDWLLTNCRTWSKSLGEQLLALENGADPLAVRAQVDELMRTATRELELRADAVKRTSV